MSDRHLHFSRTARRWLLVVALATPAAGLQADDGTSGARLNPGVLPGDIVILRDVDSAVYGQVERHAGEITSRVNARHGALEAQQRLIGIQAISLSDERAASIHGGVQGSIHHLHRALGTHPGMGARATGSASRAPSVLGGSAGGSVRSLTSGIADTLDGALAPLTGGR
ncbi:hypothetical protein [Halomonas cerina]|uniref:Uncharacterized protein n=1 Tax=Halomonas cerina TaxID=447424 RepID=A0A839VAP0_9GAMM|nr:hypothetical protein [Halomonas cerina]MBB3189576.1 hypothetical protein [Halomonas cerina]